MDKGIPRDPHGRKKIHVLVPISARKGPHFTQNMGTNFDKFRSPLHVGAVNCETQPPAFIG